MTLDLCELTADWHCPAGEIVARMVVGRDGEELLQLRVDLGVMQMFPDGRPDGIRYRGMASVQEYIRHERRLGREVSPEDWRELERELFQINYRRLALSSLLEDCLGRNDVGAATGHVGRALRDIETCLECLRVAAECDGGGLGSGCFALRPTLTFHRGRLAVQAQIITEHYEEAVEEAGRGADELDRVLAELGLDEEQRGQDPGVVFLRGLERRVRREYAIRSTLRERLAEAVENEDFEAAARLRDELRQRDRAESLRESSADER